MLSAYAGMPGRPYLARGKSVPFLCFCSNEPKPKCLRCDYCLRSATAHIVPLTNACCKKNTNAKPGDFQRGEAAGALPALEAAGTAAAGAALEPTFAAGCAEPDDTPVAIRVEPTFRLRWAKIVRPLPPVAETGRIGASPVLNAATLARGTPRLPPDELETRAIAEA